MVLKETQSKERRVLPQQAIQSRQYAWHAHDWREVVSVLSTSEDQGLTAATVKSRQAHYGPNELTEIARPGVWSHTAAQFKSPLVLVLLVAAGTTFLLGEYLDAGVIIFALLIAVVVGVFQEEKASHAFDHLAHAQTHTAVVLRDGSKHEIEATELVPGDIVELTSGVQVPADVRLIYTKHLSINEAPLTGEWQGAKKTAEVISVGVPVSDQNNMAFFGTYVADGFGRGVVVNIGDKTEVGALAKTLSTIESEETPLQFEMRRVSYFMLWIIGVLTAFLFAVGIIQGVSVHDMLLVSIAVAVASVPEGLPAAVMIILAVGMEALLKRGGLVRNLLAAETMGSTTYVLTDKTGTLTEGRMTLSTIVLSQTVNADPASWQKNSEIKHVVDTALCASLAFVENEGGTLRFHGDGLEQAVVRSAVTLGLLKDKQSLRTKRVDVLPFTSENRFAAGLAELEDGAFALCLTGAAEVLFGNATSILEAGKVVALSEAKKAFFEEKIDALTREGKRVIAVASREVDFDEIPEQHLQTLPRNCTILGVLVFDDPIRKGVKDAIKGVQAAGAEVILITGDNPETALSVARAVGIAHATDNALTGTDLEELSDEEVLVVLETIPVFARVLPQQKLRVARLLQARGEVVAMTGDGVNDALALKRANIGIAIGSGTEVAKESSDLVLVNDSFATMYAAIEEGRRIISNLRKIVGYLLSTSLSEVILIGAAVVVGAPIPILPAQILWANVVEEGLMSVAFAFEPSEKEAMKRAPQDIREEGILSTQMLWFVAYVVTLLGAFMVSFYFYVLSFASSLEEVRSVMFLVISIDSLFLSFAFRSLTVPFWRLPLHTNLFFVGSFFISLILLAVAVSIPFMQVVLSYTPLPLYDLMLILGFGLLNLLVIEVGKWVFFKERVH